MDFGALPPEVNSALMYSGAGAEPMLAAAAAWNGVASELSTTVRSFESVITRLSTEEWVSPASLSMAAAAQPFLAWLAHAAESSTRAAAQAMASAAAYEAAYAATVPPAQVAANRAQFAELIETNTLGQNMPAIAATESHYSEMWAQDASAMYQYAASSAAAGRLNPLHAPASATSAAGLANQAAAVGQAAASGPAEQAALSAVISGGPDAVLSLASPAEAEAQAGGLIGLLAAIDSMEHPFFAIQDHLRAVYADNITSLVTTMPADDDDADDVTGKAVAAAADAIESAHPGGLTHVGRAPVAAGLGHAYSVGHLSVPAGWSNSEPAAAPVVDGTYWAVPVDDETDEAVVPAPGMAASAGVAGVRVTAGPRYGVKPIVMPKQGLF